MPAKVKPVRRPVAAGPLARAYYAELRVDVKKAQAAYLDALIDKKLLDRIKADQVRRQGEKSAGRKTVIRTRAGVKVAANEEEFIRNLVFDDFRDTTDDLTAELQFTIENNDVKAYNLGGKGSQLRVGYKGVFDLKNPAVLDEIHGRAQGLGEYFADDIVDGVIKEIQVGFYDKGRSSIEVARAINSRFGEFSTSRSDNIARTEVNIMSETASFKQYNRIQIKLKQWLAYIDRKTRFDHRDISEQDPIPMQEPFIMPHTGDAVMHPGDARAPARQLCRCRCTCLPVFEDVEVAQDKIWTGN